MHELSPQLRFAEDSLQLAALSVMALVYLLKIRWILTFPAGRDCQAPAGRGDTSATHGARHSLFAILAFLVGVARLVRGVRDPLSKISHYLYYPFARWYLGNTLGHRGAYPVRRTA